MQVEPTIIETPAERRAMESELTARQQQQQQQAEQARTGEEEAGSRRGAAEKQSQFAHRSQSSPSSLTTHKFGLRPTPSPPRLIIDHQTGDIVESYPEQPTYLRTYQPLEVAADQEPHSEPLDQWDQEQDQDTSCALDESLGQSSVAGPLTRVQQYFANAGEDRLLSGAPQPPPMSQQQRRPGAAHHQQQQQRPIPPPHMHRQQQQQVYFAPPEPSAGHLFNYEPLAKQQRPQSDDDSSEARTDIAFVTRSSPAPAARVRVTGQPAAPKATPPASPKKQRPSEPTSLYDFCFHLHLLAVGLLSGLVVYLLACTQLGLECAQLRPTYTYVSLMLASVNLTCILVFSLFWYCSGVTRTMYANLSSSAFIAAIYSILVALNLALAILLFFVNTCHLQRLAETRAAPLLSPDTHRHHQLASQSESLSALASAASYPAGLDQSAFARRNRRTFDDESDAAAAAAADEDDEHEHDDEDEDAAGHLAAGEQRRPPDVAPHEPQDGEPAQHRHHFEMSPIEAGWAYLNAKGSSFWRHTLHFLHHYDLRFVGALHALCAICFQYLAMRVAVVRSYFCSPAARFV